VKASAGAVSEGLDRAEYPFASHWVTSPAGRMHYVDEGSGPPIVFVHGTPSWSFEWRALIRGLARNYRCLAPDHLGFGLSDRPREFPYTPEAHAENFQRFITQVAPGPFTLVVHDFGGPIALPFCLRQPQQVTRLVILNSWMWSLADDPALARQARFAGSAVGRLLYRYANLSLRVLMPYAYGDRRRLTPMIRAWPGESAHARAVIGLDVLAAIGSDVALMHLHGIAQKERTYQVIGRARVHQKTILTAVVQFAKEDRADMIINAHQLHSRHRQHNIGRLMVIKTGGAAQ